MVSPLDRAVNGSFVRLINWLNNQSIKAYCGAVSCDVVVAIF